MKFSIKQGQFIDKEISPEQLAVVGADKSLSWAELEQSSLGYETQLKDLGIKAGDLVTILGHKQADYISVVCACIKLGCPYIPMDDIYPKDRIARIVDIAKPFCQVNLESGQIEKLFTHVPTGPSELIYIIFTSGSTGDPKGVQISRESAVSMVNWMHEDFGMPSKPVFMNQAPFSFDLSVYELMYTLNFGATMVLSSRDQIVKEDFFDRLKENKINTWVSTPSFAWSQCINEKFSSAFLSEMKFFLFCGEILPLKLVKKLNSLFPQATILNTYGPTEATVATTLIPVTPEILAKYEYLPIGYPKKGSRVYIDDVGQICIVGDNVMNGYLNSPHLNEAKMFMSEGQRGFKTGDLGYEKDGLLFCTGRMDDQIKLHGYRIELAEIDQALMKIHSIKNAAVVPIKRGADVIRLVAFLKLENTDCSFAECKEQIQKLLPYYMVPSEFFLVDSLPLSTNHKVDRSKLLTMYSDKVVTKWG